MGWFDSISSTVSDFIGGTSTKSTCTKAVTKADIGVERVIGNSFSCSRTATTTSATTQIPRTDKRVSLNVAPLRNGCQTQDYIQRLRYVLGDGQYTLNSGQTVYGFLNSTLSRSCGLIFPYTPDIDFQHTVNYDSTEITHTNLSQNHYKSTPPPSIGLTAMFTADTRQNALHMLSALWFLRAVTKCDFGERANVDDNAVPGMPPPILYLNGYNAIMHNIPVVVTGFSYKLPRDKNYVSLGVNLDSGVQSFNDNQLYSDAATGEFFTNFDGNASGYVGDRYLNGIRASIDALQSQATTYDNNRYNNLYFNNWLPTELQLSIQMKIQPNLLQHKKNFNLNWYKMGLFNFDEFKESANVYCVSSAGATNVTNCQTNNSLLTGYEQVKNSDFGADVPAMSLPTMQSVVAPEPEPNYEPAGMSVMGEFGPYETVAPTPGSSGWVW